MAKKILITTQSLIMGGAEKALLSLIDFLKNYDVEIDLYVLEKGILLNDYENLTKVNMIPIKLPKSQKIYRINKNLLCKSLLHKYQKLIDKEYDIAIAYYGINNYSDMYAAACKAKKKFIWVHNNFENLYKLSNHKFLVKLRNMIIKKKFKYFDYIVPVSITAKEGFLNVFNDYEKKMIVINNIIDLKKLSDNEENVEKLGGNKKLLYVGRLTKTKAVDVLIKEFILVLKDVPDVKLYIIGDGEEKNNLEMLVKNNNLEEYVIFLGSKNNPYPYMKQADAIVTASKSEAYSVTLIESLALKKYFISYHNEGAKDIFKNTNQENIQNGILCNEIDMHDKIIEFLKNRDNFQPDFDIEKFNDNIKEILIKYLEL